MCQVSFTSRGAKGTLHFVLRNKVQELRKAAGLSQTELADRVNVTRQTISSIENNEYKPGVELSLKIARVFGLIVEEVFILD
jgi:putative transcriptional regulator